MRTTTTATVGDGRPATLSDRLARAAARIHAGEPPTGFTVDVMIEAAELLKALTDPDRAAGARPGLRTRMEVEA